uniref:Nucleotide exchange factor SIL1 n=1 Tax=Romanomermis culicivorax TaxID=13658 RepID=A0A915KT03_ROMCU
MFGLKNTNFVLISRILTFILFSIANSLQNSENSNSLIFVSDSDSDEGKVNLENSLNHQRNVEGRSGIFKATNEWQEILPGMQVPSGLHYRINLETGKKEAKLLSDKDEGEEVRDILKDHEEPRFKVEREHLLANEIKNALKDLEQKNVDAKPDEEQASRKTQFRSYEELKREFKEMNLEIKTDLEILKSLLDEFKSPGTKIDRRLQILEDFEYHVHQYDNAINFVNSDLKGLDVVKEALNDSDESIRSFGALILGSAAQNNPKVKVAIYENGLLHIILNLLANDQRISVSNKLLYALSALLTHFPFAQKKMIELGGLDILINRLSQTSDLKQSLKIVILLTNLLEEKRYIDSAMPSSESSERILNKKRQYDEIRLVEILRLRYQSILCPAIVSKFLSENTANINDFDVAEKVLRFFDVSVDYSICSTDDLDAARRVLLTMKDIFEMKFYEEETGSDEAKFWLDLNDKIAKILKYYSLMLSKQEL